MGQLARKTSICGFHTISPCVLQDTPVPSVPANLQLFKDLGLVTSNQNRLMPLTSSVVRQMMARFCQNLVEIKGKRQSAF